jgi:protein gp37
VRVSSNTSIEWTDSTWNPVTGCEQISPGCAHCYAKTFAERFRGVRDHPYEQGFDLRLWPERLELPLSWKKPRMVFVNSMSDLFHPDVPDDFIKQVFDVMRRASHHTFQILTKRPERAATMTDDLPWSFNVWMGTSVENQRFTTRVDDLRGTGARVKFLSCEPLLGPLDLDLLDIDWVIVGGESGHRARPMRADWARSIRDQCCAARVPFFFKQWGAHTEDGVRVGKHRSGRLLDGEVWDDLPQTVGR